MTADTKPNYLELSDEEILEMELSEETEAGGEDTSDSEDTDQEGGGASDEEEEEESSDVAEEEDAEEEDNEEEESSDDTEESSDDDEDTDEETDEDSDNGQPSGKAEEESEDKNTGKSGESTDETPDYEAFYRKLTTPFKANGRDMSLQSPEDMIRLMQMGANYNKKMAGMKPGLKVLRLLENNGLLDEQKISFYIDVEKKNPQAIAKLLKDSGINPMDIDTEEDNYKANTYTVDDREIELDSVLDDLRESPEYNRLLEVASNKWDAESKQVFANSPTVLQVIHDHMASGIYDLITEEVDRQKMLGSLRNLSDIAAYKQVGDELDKAGAFNHLFQEKPTGSATPPKEVVVEKKSKAELSKKKRAAGSSRTPGKAKKQDFNPLSLSDDEFEKQHAAAFLT